jgi:hypothetical protein
VNEMANRDPRDSVSREKTARSVYVPPSSLPDPTPEPGYVYRWVATHILGQLDPTNANKRFREGWVPVKAADHPELNLMGDTSGNVEVGGLMLCKMQKEQAEARDRYYANQAASKMESVDSTFMRNQDARMPLFSEKRSETTRGGGFGNGTK